MRGQATKEIINHIKNIMEVMLFLIVSTWFWYGPRVELQKKSELARASYAYMSGVDIKDENRITLNEENRVGTYQFKIKNNTSEEKNILVKIGQDHSITEKEECQTLSYNKINYYLSEENENDLTVRNLSINGDILVTTLQPQEEKNYTFKYFINNDINLKQNHFHGKAILSNSPNI